MKHRETRQMLGDWFEAEARAGRDDVADEAADRALESLFAAALTVPTPSPALSARLHAVAAGAAARRAVVFGMPRRLVERLAALLLLFAGLAAATVQVLFGDAAAPALAQLTPGRVFSALSEGVFFLFRAGADWLATGLDTLNTITQLSEVVAAVAGMPPVAAVLGLGLLLAVAAFKVLRDLLAKERGWTYVERN